MNFQYFSQTINSAFEYLTSMNHLVTIGFTYLIIVIVPGQDFVMVLRNSLLGSRMAGIFTALGIACGTIIHATYSVFGLGYILQSSNIAFWSLKICGGSYLTYLGITSFIKSKQHKIEAIDDSNSLNQKNEALNLSTAFSNGFLSNLLNPFAALAFISTISFLLDYNASFNKKILIILEIFLICFTWMSLMAVIFSNKSVKRQFNKMGHWIGKVSGSFLVYLGIKIFFAIN